MSRTQFTGTHRKRTSGKILNDDTLLAYNTSKQALEEIDASDLPTKLNSKSYSVTSQGLGAAVTLYAAGYYDAPAADADLTQASLTQLYGTAGSGYGAHAFIVASDAGTVDAGVVGLKVTGTSITSGGVRTTGDEEILSLDITALATDGYLETSKKWLGQVTFTLYAVSGSPTTYAATFNYGLCKYDDLGNNDSIFVGFECVGLAGATDAGFDIEFLHHKTTGWTYHATAFVPGTTPLAKFSTDYADESGLISGEYVSYKRVGFTQAIEGSGSEGYLLRITTTANNSLEIMDCHVGSIF